ncbi:MAG: tetratricopeptide repeat protein, partial [Candidatus Erginobacter occultus]|nr:tetratricopeptide repeat protein [Candidatus Erginobacter occultus]
QHPQEQSGGRCRQSSPARPIRKRAGGRRLAAAASGLLLGVLAAVLPVTIRNYAVSGELVPISTNAGISFGVANNELSDGTTHFIPGIGNIGTPFDWPRIVRKLEADLGRPLGHGEASNYLTRRALSFALRSPGSFLRLTGRKALLFWGPREIRNLREVHYARLHSPLLRRLPGNFSLVLALAILGAVLIFAFPQPGPPGRAESRTRGGALFLTLILIYFLSMLPFAAGARYRVPVIPFLLILGASAVRRIAALLADRKWLTSLFAAAAAGGLYLLCSVNYAGFQPSPEKWHYDRGLARLGAGNWEEAVSEFDRALIFQPGYGSAYTNRGIALQKAGRPGPAAESYRSALRLDPGSLPPRKNLADLLLEEGKADEAFALYREALKSGPEYTGVAVDLARGLAREGRGEEAAAVYREILRQRPDSFAARLGLGNLLLEAGDPAAAREEYRAALEINPHSALARYNLANVLIAEGRIKEGIAEYREILRRDPAHRDGHNNLGIQLAARGELAEAIRHFSAAIGSDPTDPAGYYNRGVALIKLGRPGEAVADLEKTLELSPDYEPARRALAAARRRQ